MSTASQESTTVETSQTGESQAGLPSWLRRELILAAILIGVGVLLLPLAIYFTGQALLGPYSADGHGPLRLYADILGDLVDGALPAWILVLSPWLGVQALRLALIPLRRKTGPGREPESDQPVL